LVEYASTSAGSSSQDIGPDQNTLTSLFNKVGLQTVANRHRHGTGEGEEGYHLDPGGYPMSDQSNDEVSDDDKSFTSAK
jgi:hypothetical protein